MPRRSTSPPTHVLVLPGGQPTSVERSKPWQLSRLRMLPFTRALRRGLGREAKVTQVAYAVRGWNGGQRSPVLDAQRVLAASIDRHGEGPVILVGHSMGGRVAVHLAHELPAGTTVIALAPWWPQGDAGLVKAGQRLRVAHGTADTWTDPRASERQTRDAQARGVDANWLGVDDARHHLMDDAGWWHRWAVDQAQQAKDLQSLASAS